MRIPVALSFILIAGQAFATGEIESLITDADRDRLARFDDAVATARDEAAGSQDRAARATLDTALDAPALELVDFDLTGAWRCRTIKAGGITELVVYGWFACRVTDDGSGWQLEKLTGSQRTLGRFFTESDTAMTYLGALYVAGDPAPRYGARPESDQVGRATRTGKTSWQIVFPFPHYESTLDILELRR